MEGHLIQLEFSDGKTVQAIIPKTWESEEETKDVLLTAFKIIPARELEDDYRMVKTETAFKEENQ